MDKRDSIQERVHEALAERSQELAGTYLGAVKVFQDKDNPDRLALAAHGLRELIEKIPRYWDIPVRQREEKMGDKVQRLKPSWDSACRVSQCRQVNSWEGEIDKPLQAFLDGVGSFFQWVEENRPRRKEAARNSIRAIDAAQAPPPPQLENENVREWEDIRDFFVNVAHHQSLGVTPETFEERMLQLERFLLERLKPQTVEDFGIIDSIIQEGEANG
jgi:hypothetical protein